MGDRSLEESKCCFQSYELRLSAIDSPDKAFRRVACIFLFFGEPGLLRCTSETVPQTLSYGYLATM
jgi:hypothetical protein